MLTIPDMHAWHSSSSHDILKEAIASAASAPAAPPAAAPQADGVETSRSLDILVPSVRYFSTIFSKLHSRLTRTPTHREVAIAARAQFTCFTSTKVQILTPEELRASRLVDHAHTASPAGVRNEENRIKMLRLWSKVCAHENVSNSLRNFQSTILSTCIYI